MRALLLILMLNALPGLVWAATVKVTSGEHGQFTRLVIEHGPGVEWQVGTTPDGYEVRLTGPELAFDLADAFRLIGRGRLGAMDALPTGPTSASLRLVLACPCHIRPFAFRPGTLVVDILDGPPAVDDPIEQPLPAAQMAPPDMPAFRPRPRPVSLSPPVQQAETAGRIAEPEQPQQEQSQELRDSLLRELSDGAARGVVRMTLPESLAAEDPDVPPAPLAQIRAGVDLGVVILPDQDSRETMTGDGMPCIASSRIAVAEWAVPAPVSASFAAIRHGLVGEFDHTDQEALGAAVRAHLFMGFGVEARQLIQTFGARHEDQDLWRDMGAILDGLPTENRFAGMTGCDTDAALWALLSISEPPEDLPINEDAVIRAFAALPPHLRHRFAGDLIGIFSARGDASTVQSLQLAIDRVDVPGTGRTALIKADLMLAAEDAAMAEIHAITAVQDHRRSNEMGIVQLVESQAAQDKPVTPDRVLELQALLREYAGTDQGADLRRGLAIAAAASGDYDLGLSVASDATPALPEVWRLLARNAPDDVFLARSVLAAGEVPLFLPFPRRKAVAERLMSLGFPDHALLWLDISSAAEADQAEASLLAAQANLGRGDPAAALRLIAGRQDEPVSQLRAAAMAAMKDPAPIDPTLEQLVAAQVWFGVAAAGDAAWSPAARWALPEQGPPATPGPLAASRKMLEDSRMMRDDLTVLLGQTRAAGIVSGAP